MASTATTPYPHIALDIRGDVYPITTRGNYVSQDKSDQGTAEPARGEPARGEPARGTPGSKVALRIEELGSRQLKGSLVLSFIGGTLGLVAAVVASSTFASTDRVLPDHLNRTCLGITLIGPTFLLFNFKCKSKLIGSVCIKYPNNFFLKYFTSSDSV